MPDLSEEDALAITADTILKLIQGGVDQMILTTDNDVRIEVKFTILND